MVIYYILKKVRKISRKEKRKQKYKLNFIRIFQIIFIVLIIVAGVNIINWFKDNNKSKQIQKEISGTVTVEVDEDNNSLYKIDFKALRERNNDVVGWLKVNNTNIEYPVVKTNNNYFYLDHSFDKSANNVGWIFADYRLKMDGTDRNIVIYGHNRRDGEMFGTLKNILSGDWYNNEENLKVIFATEDEYAEYQVFSIYEIENEDYYITTSFTEYEFESFIKTIKSRSVKDFGVDVTTEDKILTLSTCANNNKYRVVLHAKKID